jgi:AraC-like DNA-binding protein
VLPRLNKCDGLCHRPPHVQYEEHRPLPALAPFIERVWTLAGHASMLRGALQPVLPDGRPELILHLGDRFDRIPSDGPPERQDDLIFAGQMTAQLVLRPTGAIKVLGIRFEPFGASALFRVPQHELAGLTPDLAAISAPLARELRRVQETAASLAMASVAAQQALLPFLSQAKPDPRIRHAVSEITRRRGVVSIDRIATATGLTRRHLERQFRQQVGVSPKRLARISRFQYALQLLEDSDSAQRGTLTAAACGYADQAHFIRDFRELAGCPPTAHLLQQAELTRFFIDKGRI